MIAELALGGVLAAGSVLAHYEAALAAVRPPPAMSFDYTLEETGARSLMQSHRVFRSGGNERDETLIVDGRHLDPPSVRVFRGRRDRYLVSALAPRADRYAFVFAGTRRDGRHLDYVFRLKPAGAPAFAATEVTIDGVKFLPQEVVYAAPDGGGRAAVSFGLRGRWWVATSASARTGARGGVSLERLTFWAYRFPPSLPPETFAVRPPRGEPSRRPRRALPN